MYLLVLIFLWAALSWVLGLNWYKVTADAVYQRMKAAWNLWLYHIHLSNVFNVDSFLVSLFIDIRGAYRYRRRTDKEAPSDTPPSNCGPLLGCRYDYHNQSISSLVVFLELNEKSPLSLEACSEVKEGSGFICYFIEFEHIKEPEPLKPRNILYTVPQTSLPEGCSEVKEGSGFIGYFIEFKHIKEPEPLKPRNKLYTVPQTSLPEGCSEVKEGSGFIGYFIEFKHIKDPEPLKPRNKLYPVPRTSLPKGCSEVKEGSGFIGYFIEFEHIKEPEPLKPRNKLYTVPQTSLPEGCSEVKEGSGFIGYFIEFKHIKDPEPLKPQLK